MAGVAYYRLVDCCNADNFTLINIPASPGIVPDGIYTFTTDIPNVGGTTFDIVSGNCYNLTYESSVFNSYPSVPYATLVLEQAGTFADCTAATTCPDCNTGQYYIKADPCCGGDAIFLRGEPYIGGGQGGAMPSFSITDFDGIYLVIAPNAPGNPNRLVRNECYTFSHGVVGDGLPGAPADMAAYNLLLYPPFVSELYFMHPDDCTALSVSGDGVRCPECDPICYLLTNCDGETIQTTIDAFSTLVGSYVELQGLPGSWFVQINEGVCTDPVLSLKITNTSADPCPCNCYEVISAPGLVTYIDCNGVPQSTYAPDKFCAQSPPLVKEVENEPSPVVVTRGLCEDGECPDRCFQLINCDPTKYPDQNAIITSTLQSLYQYINPSSVVELAGYEGCWTVIEATCLCISVDINGSLYEANYSGSTYNDNKVFTLEVLGVTYYIWANLTAGSWVISQSVGADTGSTLLAEIKSGVPDCPIADSSVWQNGQLPDGGAVTAVATVECPGEQACDCPVDVTVLQDYRTCIECIGPTAYKLTNCDGGEVTYSIQDLSEYVDSIIKDDCHCWLVEEIDYEPPSNATISNIVEFTDCASCLATFYQLTICDVTSTLPPIITPTNLSAYLNQVVQLEGCDGCYTVTLYAGTGQPPNQQPVEVTSAFATCLECETVVPRCSTVFNTSTEDQVFQYIDVNGNTQSTDTICSGHSSLRYCVQKWIEPAKAPNSGIFNYYGDCSVFDVVGSPDGCDCVNISITATDGTTFSGLAVWDGTTYDGRNILSFVLPTVSGDITYYIWYAAGTQSWHITQNVGVVSFNDIGNFTSTSQCPIFTDAEWVKQMWPDPLQAITFLQTTESSKCAVRKYKIGECIQYFPNDRKVKPGYNTPICSAQKYDKITCNFAEIAYKEALALRYGISNCCPELDEKWLISKELIELQALYDPQFKCAPITDCCDNTGSDCSCNS